MLLFENPCRQRLDRILIQHRDGRLDEDWPRVEALVHEMNRASGDLHSMLQCLVLGVEPRESRKQGRMNIQDTLRVLSDEISAQQAHETSHANQLDPIFLQFLDKLPA